MLLTVETSERGLSLKRFLSKRFPSHSIMYLAARVFKGHCFVDGELADWGRKLRGGERIDFDIDLEAATARTPEPIPLDILYEDRDLLAVNKPPGMLVHPTKHVKTGTLCNGLAHYFAGERFWLPHRLDRETSGVIVVAKTAASTNRLARFWISRQVEKRYVALLDGIVSQDRIRIEAPIGRKADRKPEWAIDSEGKDALTDLEVLDRRRNHTLVALAPITGRTNQLRLHTAHLGHPILGDQLYGGTPAERLFLHAREIILPNLRLEAPLEIQTGAWAEQSH